MWELLKTGSKASQFLRDESGATAIEYSLIAAIMGIGIIAGLRALQVATDASLNATGTAIDTALP